MFISIVPAAASFLVINPGLGDAGRNDVNPCCRCHCVLLSLIQGLRALPQRSSWPAGPVIHTAARFPQSSGLPIPGALRAITGCRPGAPHAVGKVGPPRANHGRRRRGICTECSQSGRSVATPARLWPHGTIPQAIDGGVLGASTPGKSKQWLCQKWLSRFRQAGQGFAEDSAGSEAATTAWFREKFPHFLYLQEKETFRFL